MILEIIGIFIFELVCHKFMYTKYICYLVSYAPKAKFKGWTTFRGSFRTSQMCEHPSLAVWLLDNAKLNTNSQDNRDNTALMN